MQEGQVENPNDPIQSEERRDPLRDLQARVESALDDVRPKIRRALEELGAGGGGRRGGGPRGAQGGGAHVLSAAVVIVAPEPGAEAVQRWEEHALRDVRLVETVAHFPLQLRGDEDAT